MTGESYCTSTDQNTNRNINDPLLRLQTKEAWAPIVLSLDGGGIRGLSSLYILKRIMQRVEELAGDDNPVAEVLKIPGSSISPCYYFDFIMGTSTGGLIATMLGRLRMDVDECISQYHDLSVRIFTPRRYLRLYSGKRLKKCIIQVIQNHCKCSPECVANIELFRQYDYAEEDDHIGNPNFTCKTIVVSQRHGDNADETYLFRSYNHKPRQADNFLEPNPGTLERSRVKIWEACRATSAAPFYFPKIRIEKHWHMDGAVGENNPSPLAWNEAAQMTSTWRPNRPGAVAMLVSIGTGAPQKESRFGGPLNLVKWIRRNITDTRKPHAYVNSIAQTSDSPYYRFDVGHGESHRMEHNGISTIKLSDCKPRTLDTLKSRTQVYLDGQGADENVPRLIEDCARLLLDHARRRRTENMQRWKRFISHPNPGHPQYINPDDS